MNDASTSPQQALDSRTRLLAMINANWMTQAVCAAAALRIADLLADGPQTVDALAAAASCHPPSLRRLLRALVTLDICDECSDGRFAAGPLAPSLREDAADSLRGYALFRSSQWESWGQLAASVRTGDGFRKRKLGHDDFRHLDGNAAGAELFHRAMTDMTRRVARELVDAFDFARFRSLVDVGGGHGELLAAILEAHPAAHGIVYDLEHARAGADARFATAGIAARASFAAGSFFDSVPAGYDLYMLKSVLHDWDDERASLIVRNCRDALQADARLLIVERIVPDRLSASPRDQAIAAADLNMLVSLSGRERTEAEFASLLAAASLRVEGIVPTAGAFHAIVAMRAG